VTVIDFHPDDLLEREGTGTLSAVEQRRLTDHLARCASCRIERQLRADFEQELGPQSSPDMLQALVSGALRAARTPERAPDAEAAVGERSRVHRPRRPLATLLAVGIALGTGLAAARSDVGVRALDVAREQVRRLLGQSPTPSTKTATEARDLSPRAAPSEVAAPAASRSTEIEPSRLPASGTKDASGVGAPDPERVRERTDSSITSTHSSKGPARSSSPRAEYRDEPRARSSRAGNGVAAHVERASGAGAPRTARALRAEWRERPPRDSLSAARGSAADPREMSELFERANAARRRGSGAEALYQELQARFPQSAEARLSQAILGRMKLDSGDAEAAVTHFEEYLSTGDRALREQALAGCALAWARLGRADRERQRWRDLLALYPGSSYAGLARRRLAREVP